MVATPSVHEFDQETGNHSFGPQTDISGRIVLTWTSLPFSNNSVTTTTRARANQCSHHYTKLRQLLHNQHMATMDQCAKDLSAPLLPTPPIHILLSPPQVAFPVGNMSLGTRVLIGTIYVLLQTSG